MTPKQRVLRKFPKAWLLKVVWPCEIYWVMAKPNAKDSISGGKPTARQAWADAAMTGAKHG